MKIEKLFVCVVVVFDVFVRIIANNDKRRKKRAQTLKIREKN